ncbi:putative membrane protein [Exiguobacterium sp. S17]|nr:putative membrane protein [Exiguobacterium sp. S17]
MRLLASLISLGFACLISLELWQGPFYGGWIWSMQAFFLIVSFFQFMKHLNELEWSETK